MTVTRRQVLGLMGGLVPALLLPGISHAGNPVEIQMRGSPDGSRVWFDPIGVLITPGQSVRWTNRDPGNSHTATAYHPANFDRPRRIPGKAAPWNSDYLLPDESFSVTLTQTGVYDFYCVPHEHAGMVGRIVVGTPEPPGWTADPRQAGGPPEGTLFPPVEEIMKKRIVRRT